jgi:hypothetical protein
LPKSLSSFSDSQNRVFHQHFEVSHIDFWRAGTQERLIFAAKRLLN